MCIRDRITPAPQVGPANLRPRSGSGQAGRLSLRAALSSARERRCLLYTSGGALDGYDGGEPYGDEEDDDGEEAGK